MKRVLALVLSVTLWQTASAQTRPAQARKTSASAFAWLCEKLGIPLDVYNKIQGVRGEPWRLTGRLVVSLDLASGAERVVASCDACFSPQPLPGGATLFAKADGVWLAAAGNSTPRLLLAKKDVRGILGVFEASSTRAIVAADDANGCEISVLDVERGTADSAEWTNRLCEEILHVRRWGRINTLRVVSQNDPPSADLLMETVPALDRVGSVGNRVIPIARPLSDVQTRLDPVWAGGNVLVYLAR